MTEQYFLITGSEDGTQIQSFASRHTLQDYLNEEGIYVTTTTWRTGFSDTNYWGEHEALLIKGAIIVPKAKRMVDTWEIP